MNEEFSFIVIDDSELDCFVTKKFLERSNENLSIKTFQNAQQALEVIRECPDIASLMPTVILLDLQMPFMSGFDFVKEFETLPVEVQRNYEIIVLTILTTANSATDIHRIFTYGTVKSIIEKPLTKEKLTSLLNLVRPGN